MTSVVGAAVPKKAQAPACATQPKEDPERTMRAVQARRQPWTRPSGPALGVWSRRRRRRLLRRCALPPLNLPTLTAVLALHPVVGHSRRAGGRRAAPAADRAGRRHRAHHHCQHLRLGCALDAQLQSRRAVCGASAMPPPQLLGSNSLEAADTHPHPHADLHLYNGQLPGMKKGDM